MSFFKRLDLSTYVNLLLVAALIVSLAAPFTFLPVTKNAPDSVQEKQSNKPEKPKKIEKPLHNVKLPNFAVITDVKERKRKFFNFIRPSIERENNKLLALRAQVKSWRATVQSQQSLSAADKILLDQLVVKYRVNKKYPPSQQLEVLLRRVDVIPNALVLVQAANESAWGTSRFSRIGLNFFGIWCYKPGCGMTPNDRNEGSNHEVQAFKNVDEAVRRYLHNINTNNAYVVFRTIRAQLRKNNQPLSSKILATGLISYSERGADYVLEITDMLRHNRRYFKNDMSD